MTNNNTNLIKSFLYPVFAICTAMIGKQIHGSIFWSLVDFFFTPLVWIKWLLYEEVNLTIIKSTFAFFF